MCSQSVALGYEAQKKRMRARLKAKARRWKITVLRATKRHRRNKEQLRRCRHRIAKLENRIQELEAITIDRVGDVTYLLMNLVKKQYKSNDLLSCLCAKIGTLRSQTLLGRYGFLAPPTLWDKDRFLRIFNILDWVTKIDEAANVIDETASQRLAFIDSYRSLLEELAQVRVFISFTAAIFKSQCLSHSSSEQWRARVRDWMEGQHNIFEAVTIMVAAMEQYLTDHQTLIDKYMRLVCCSDITESTFGRYKNKVGLAESVKYP
jgi:hypothetical protein